MKRLIFAAILLGSLSCHAMPWDKEKKSYIKAACKEPSNDHSDAAYVCCLYNQMEDDEQVPQWVPIAALAKAKKSCARGGANPCDCLGVGVHNGMTYSYEGSGKCLPDSPIYESKGEIAQKQSLATICKNKTDSEEVVLVPAPALS